MRSSKEIMIGVVVVATCVIWFPLLMAAVFFKIAGELAIDIWQEIRRTRTR